MTSRFLFTKQLLEQLPLQEKLFVVSDTKVPGLRMTIYPSGMKTFMVYRKVKGKPQRIKVGRLSDLTLEQARRQAIKLNALIALGGDPLQERKEERKKQTFKHLADAYYKEYAIHHTKRPGDNKKIIDYHITPQIGSTKIEDITREKLQSIHSKIGIRHKSMANRIMHVVSAIFNFGIRQNYYNGINPCIGLKKYRLSSRDRFLSRDELKAFFEAVQMEEEIFQHFFLLALYTGARKANVLSMRWADVNLDLKIWRISETETKNQDVNTVYLSEVVSGILVKRNAANKSQTVPSLYVLPGDGTSGHLKDPKRSFERIKQRMNVSDIRIHDLRRTLGSYMAINGASLPVIAKALNHKSQISTAIYARLSQEPVREAIDKAILFM